MNSNILWIWPCLRPKRPIGSKRFPWRPSSSMNLEKFYRRPTMEKESLHDPCAHAEILALRRAGERRQNWRLLKGTLISTLEPCPMCLGGTLQARVEALVFAAYDLKGGALSLGHDLSFRGKLRIMGGYFNTHRPVSSLSFSRSIEKHTGALGRIDRVVRRCTLGKRVGGNPPGVRISPFSAIYALSSPKFPVFIGHKWSPKVL